MNINVHIERLILDGVPESSAQGPAVGAAVESELARLLTIEGLAASASRAEPHLPAGHIHLMPEVSPPSLGQQIGAAVYHVLNQPKQTTRNQKAKTL
jgi:hypothetical protein